MRADGWFGDHRRQGPGVACSCGGSGGKEDSEGGPYTNFRFDCNPPSHVRNQLLDQCETETGATMLSRQEVFELLEFLKDHAQAFRRDANAGIAHNECNLFAASLHLQ